MNWDQRETLAAVAEPAERLGVVEAGNTGAGMAPVVVGGDTPILAAHTTADHTLSANKHGT